MLFDVMKEALQDELEKIAGELQGHVRGGRRPLSATTLLDKEKEDSKGTQKKLADLTKVSGIGKAVGSKLSPDAKTLGLLGIGAYGLHKVQQAKRRHDLGYQVEQQQRGY